MPFGSLHLDHFVSLFSFIKQVICLLIEGFVHSIMGKYYGWKASTLRKWLKDAEAELEQHKKGKEKGLREGEEQV